MDRIEFSVGGTVLITRPLPDITNPVILDGRTAPGYNASATDIKDAPPEYYLLGSGVPVGLNFDSAALGSEVRALGLLSFTEAAISTFRTAGSPAPGPGEGLQIDACWIGLQRNGVAFPNQAGVRLRSEGNTVGATADEGGLGNVISGNLSAGVFIDAQRRNALINNRIGTDPGGTVARPNKVGVRVVANDNDIGFNSSRPGAGNLISGNTDVGVSIEGQNNRVQGNEIGGTVVGGVLGNGESGIWIFGDNNLVGSGSAQNFVSGSEYGIRLGWATVGSATDTLIQANTISASTIAGIFIDEGDSNTISSNLISQNRVGIHLDLGIGNALIDNRISSNQAQGVLATAGSWLVMNGNRVLENEGGPGVQIESPQAQLTANTVSLNGDAQVVISADRALLCGNTLGFSGPPGRGGVDEPTLGTGVRLEGNDNTLGSFNPACEGNIVARNETGVEIRGAGNVAVNNFVFANQNSGFMLEGESAERNSIMANEILDNGSDGVTLWPDVGEGNLIFANAFSGNGGEAIDLDGDGVTLNDFSDDDEGPNRLQNYPKLLSVVAESNGSFTAGGGGELWRRVQRVPAPRWTSTDRVASRRARASASWKRWSTRPPAPSKRLV